MNGDMKKLVYVLILSMVVTACKKPYNPPVISSPGSYLVVEGSINSGSDSTIIKISQTVNLSSRITLNPVLHAIVAVEGDQNVVFPLKETINGNYVSGGLNLDNTHKYRLSIKTTAEQYYSDYVPVLNSPPIDSVYFTVTNNNGININSATHDPTNNVKYYRWYYQETWIFHSNYQSLYKSNGDTVLSRDLNNDEIYTCWGSDTSSTIILGSTANLSKDLVMGNVVAFVPSTSEKLGTEYSIIVRQYALTADAYNFWINLKKNTEQLGSIFDAQPSQINGNIYSASNPGEAVIGYISVGSIGSERIFITNRQLPNWLAARFDPDCQLDSLLYDHDHENEVNEFIDYKSASYNYEQFIPVSSIYVSGSPKIAGYTASEAICVDCTLRGTNKQPFFWK